MAWYTFTLPTNTAAGAEQLPPHVSFERLWNTALFRSPEACLFVGAPGPLGKRHYLALPEAGEELAQDFLRNCRATHLDGTPEEPEGVRLLVGVEARAQELWEARITCSRDNPEGCVTCSG